MTQRRSTRDPREAAILAELRDRVAHLDIDAHLRQSIAKELFDTSRATLTHAVHSCNFINLLIELNPSLSPAQQETLEQLADDLLRYAREATQDAYARAQSPSHPPLPAQRQPDALDIVIREAKVEWDGLKAEIAQAKRWLLPKSQEESVVDNIKLPTARPSRAAQQDFDGLTKHPEQFLPDKVSKPTQKRITKAREEALVRVVVFKGRALLEKIAADYRFAAKRYTAERLIEEADYYQTLVDTAQTKGGKTVARQVIKQWTIDLYTFMWDLSKTADEQTRDLVQKDLYPESEEERSWLQELGVWMSQGRA